MKQTHALVKVAVVLSSVLLVAGFVSYRAGAFDRLLRRHIPAMFPSTKSSTLYESDGSPARPIQLDQLRKSQQPPASATPSEPTVWSSSKYGFIRPPIQTDPTPQVTTDLLKEAIRMAGSESIIMGGSKSLSPPTAPAGKKPAAPPPSPQQSPNPSK